MPRPDEPAPNNAGLASPSIASGSPGVFGRCVAARREADLSRRCGKRLALKPRLNFPLVDRLVLVLLRITIQHGNSGQDENGARTDEQVLSLSLALGGSP